MSTACPASKAAHSRPSRVVLMLSGTIGQYASSSKTHAKSLGNSSRAAAMSTALCERAHPKALMAWAGCFDFCNADVTPKVAEASRVKCNRQVPTFSRSARLTRLAPQTPRGTMHCSGCSALTSRLVAFRRPSSSGRLTMYAGVDAMEKTNLRLRVRDGALPPAPWCGAQPLARGGGALPPASWLEPGCETAFERAARTSCSFRFARRGRRGRQGLRVGHGLHGPSSCSARRH